MRKFWAILCIIAMMTVAVAPAGPVMAADDPYDFDGDIVDNPWAELFTTTAEGETTVADETTTVAVETTTVAAAETTTEDSANKPAAPLGLTYAGNKNLPYYFAWAPVEGVNSYNFYVNGELVGNSTATNYNASADYFPTAGDYIIGVTAVDSAGVESNMSTIVYTVVGETTTAEGETLAVPAAPLGLTYAGNEVFPYYFAWAPSTGATSYNIYINGELVGNTDVENYNASVTLFPTEGDYEISVTAVNDAGESEKTTIVYTVGEVITTAPGATEAPTAAETTTVAEDQPAAPLGLTYAGNAANPYYFAWAPVDTAVSYNFYVDGVLVGSNTETNYSATAEAFPTEGDYVVGVTAVNEAGIESPMTTIVYTVVGETTTAEGETLAVPAAPEGLTYAGNEVFPYYFAWAPSTGATSYNIYINGELAGNSDVENYNASVSLFPTTGDYTIGVTAVNDAGESGMTTIVYTVTEVITEPETTTADTSIPAAVEGLTWAGNDLQPYWFAWAAAEGAVSYNFYINGELVNTDVNPWYNASVKLFPEIGDYEITVTYMTADGVESAEATIVYTVTEVITEDPTVSNEFAIVSQPKNVTVPAGTSASFSIEATGEGLTYSWEMSKDGGLTWAKSTVDGYKTNSINFVATEAYHGRQYRCVVTDANGETVVSEPGTVLIEELVAEIVIISQPESVTVANGGKGVMTVSAIGNGLTYQWEMSSDGGQTWATSTVDGCKTARIEFIVTEAYHGRQYRCVVKDENGNEVASEAGVVVSKELENSLMITSHPKTVIIPNGTKGVMTVGAMGEGLTYQWEMSKDGGQTWTTSSVDGCHTSRIEFIITEAYHGRQYRCVVTDVNGDQAISNAGVCISKELENELMITSHPKTVTAASGSKGVMTVGAMGEGLTYQWEMSKDGGQTWTTSTVDGCHTARIEFTATEAYHGRQYRCVVTDVNGDQAISNGGVVVVKELEAELMITTHPKTVTVASGAKGKMTVGAMGKGLTYQWEMSKDAGLTWTTSTVDGCHTNKIEFTATDAYHGRLYRCVITDENGESVTSVGGAVVVEEFADTLKVIVEPSDVTVAAGTSTSVSFSAIGVGLKYQWEMSKDGGATWATSTVDGCHTNTIKFTATSAYNGRQYRCVVTDAEGNTVTTRGTVITVQ